MEVHIQSLREELELSHAYQQQLHQADYSTATDLYSSLTTLINALGHTLVQLVNQLVDQV